MPCGLVSTSRPGHRAASDAIALVVSLDSVVAGTAASPCSAPCEPTIMVDPSPRCPPISTSDRPVISARRSEEHTSELQSLMRISYAVFCLKKKTTKTPTLENEQQYI